MDLFSLSSAQMRHLSLRQMTLARNISNISTPGYIAQDVKPFQAHIGAADVALKVSHDRHVQDDRLISGPLYGRSRSPQDASTSGNNVILETEIQRAGEVRRHYETTSSITKSFHKMFLATVRG